MNGAGYRSNPAAAGTNAAYSGRLDAAESAPEAWFSSVVW
jgi:hypothetical protein